MKECKYIDKKVIRHINDSFSGFSCDDNSNEEYSHINILIMFTIFKSSRELLSLIYMINQTPDEASHFIIQIKGT